MFVVNVACRLQDPDIAESLESLAANLAKQGKMDDAEACFRRALSVLEQTMSPSNARVQACRENLAKLLVALGRDEEAQQFRVERGCPIS